MPHRPLSALLMVLLALGAMVSVEAYTRFVYRTRDGLLDKAVRFAAEARAEDKNLVILGTCLPEQHILAPVLERRLGSGWVVHNLGNEATNTLDWYLAFANELPVERIQGLIVAYGEADLVAPISPWESRVLDLTRWSDLPDLAHFACQDADCRVDLVLRKASATWRYRARLSNGIWQGLGALPGAAMLAPPKTETDTSGPAFYIQRLVAAAKEKGVPLWLLPLPRRPVESAAAPPRALAAAVDPVPEARRLVLPRVPAEYFNSETHLTIAGARLVTEYVADALRKDLGLPDPPPYTERPEDVAGRGPDPPNVPSMVTPAGPNGPATPQGPPLP